MKLNITTFFEKYKIDALRILFFQSLAFILVSCSLDFPVEDEITGLDAIDNIAIASETLSGVYLAYPKNKINFSKLADDFYPNHTIADNVYDYQFYNWNKSQIQFFSNSLWSSYYATISKANMLLSRTSKIETTIAKEQIQLKNIEAEALCLKALCFFDLIQIYTKTYSETTKNDLGIILKDNIASEKLSRSSIEDSYKATEKLLLKAILLFSDEQITSYRFSKISTKMLLAKLYFNWKKYEKVIELCDEVIPKSRINDTSFEQIWKDLQKNDREKIIVSETILAMEETLSYFTEIYDKQQNEDEYYLNTSITFDTNDVRKETILISETFRNIDNSTKQVNYLGKLRNEVTDTEGKCIPVFRVAELYFIKGESLYHLSRENEAKDVVNTFLRLRKTSKITSTGTSFLVDLLKEKQKEFIGEGIRYFDMKRNKVELDRVNYQNNGNSDVVVTIDSTDFRWLFPIEKNELKYNENIVNNSGW